MKKILPIILCIFVTSCNSLIEFRDEIRAFREERYSNKCVQRGFTKNTDAHRLCIQNLNLERKIRNLED
jgi:hypothetical protein